MIKDAAECLLLLGVGGFIASGSFLILSRLGPGNVPAWNPGTFTSFKLCNGSGSGGIISCFILRFCGSIGGVPAKLYIPTIGGLSKFEGSNGGGGGCIGWNIFRGSGCLDKDSCSRSLCSRSR